MKTARKPDCERSKPAAFQMPARKKKKLEKVVMFMAQSFQDLSGKKQTKT